VLGVWSPRYRCALNNPEEPVPGVIEKLPLVALRSRARLAVSTGLTATQSIGAKRKTARRKSLRRAVVDSSRGDKTAIELFVGGVRGWGAALRRWMEADKPKQN
jgi:hypothetical protein